MPDHPTIEASFLLVTELCILLLTTEGVPARERFEYWREAIGRRALEFLMQPVTEKPQHGSVRVESTRPHIAGSHRRCCGALHAPTRRSITEIAFDCGFNESSHFGRALASRRGVTPSEWRKRARQ